MPYGGRFKQAPRYDGAIPDYGEVFCDMEEELRKNGIPLFALESGDPVREFDIIGFSVGYYPQSSLLCPGGLRRPMGIF